MRLLKLEPILVPIQELILMSILIPNLVLIPGLILGLILVLKSDLMIPHGDVRGTALRLG